MRGSSGMIAAASCGADVELGVVGAQVLRDGPRVGGLVEGLLMEADRVGPARAARSAPASARPRCWSRRRRRGRRRAARPTTICSPTAACSRVVQQVDELRVVAPAKLRGQVRRRGRRRAASRAVARRRVPPGADAHEWPGRQLGEPAEDAARRRDVAEPHELGERLRVERAVRRAPAHGWPSARRRRRSPARCGRSRAASRRCGRGPGVSVRVSRSHSAIANMPTVRSSASSNAPGLDGGEQHLGVGVAAPGGRRAGAASSRADLRRSCRSRRCRP